MRGWRLRAGKPDRWLGGIDRREEQPHHEPQLPEREPGDEDPAGDQGRDRDAFGSFGHGGGIASIGQDRQMTDTGDKLAQEFKPLGSKIRRLKRQTSDVAAWSRET